MTKYWEYLAYIFSLKNNPLFRNFGYSFYINI